VLGDEIERRTAEYFRQNAWDFAAYARFKESDIQPTVLKTYDLWEEAAYLLGLFVARREYPRLSMAGNVTGGGR
jgi:hypothetical protein